MSMTKDPSKIISYIAWEALCKTLIEPTIMVKFDITFEIHKKVVKVNKLGKCC